VDRDNNKKKYLVIGLGVTGLSVVEYLFKQGFNVIVTDSRDKPPSLDKLTANFPQVTALLGKITIPDDITNIILSPGVALEDQALAPALAKKLPIIGDIELFAQVVDKPVLAITGSNGKSTVTTLLGLMAQESNLKVGVGGNLGTPALSLLNNNNDCYVLELSSFQLESLNSLQPCVATILNIAPEHMDRYSGFESYVQAKHRIYSMAKKAVFNRADPTTYVSSKLEIPAVSFGVDKPEPGNYGVIDHNGGKWLAKGAEPLIAAKELGIPGKHNVANALAALAMGEIAGFKLSAMLTVLRQFKGLRHCCEKIITTDNILWIDDSKGTNVAATVASLQGVSEAVSGKWLIILGGASKNADFTPLVEPLQKYCRAAILIGAEQQNLWDLLHTKIACHKASSLAQAVEIASATALAGDGVLLSPACASLDMFDNYAHRGTVFKQQVLERTSKQDETRPTA